jgi:MGT family glycosyltransferase
VTRRKLNDLLTVLRDLPRPDIVVRETTDFAGLLVAEILGVPHVTVGAGLFIDVAWWRRLLRGSLDRIRTSYSLPADPACARLYEHLYLDLVPPWFQQFPQSAPSTHRFFRVDQEPDARQAGPRWLRQLTTPTVYLTLGTVYNGERHVFATALRALGDEPVTVVCTIGRDQDPSSLDMDLPANAIVRRYIPQGLLLPHADVIVTHGGYNTLAGALRHDVLPVLIPLGADHPANAQRCLELGIGVVIEPHQLTEAAVREATLSLLDAPGRRRRLRRLRRTERGVPTLRRAVARLEQLAQCPLPSRAGSVGST